MPRSYDKYRGNLYDKCVVVYNNRCERAIKPFVMGRKTFLFSKTAKGANASATLYSIVETAKANGLVPYDYLMHVMEKIMHGETDSEKLAPWNVTLS